MKSKNKADSQCHPQKYIIFHWNLYLSLNTIPDKNQTKTFSFQSVSEIWTRVTCSCQGEADIPAFLSVVLTTFITILFFISFVNTLFNFLFSCTVQPCAGLNEKVCCKLACISTFSSKSAYGGTTKLLVFMNMETRRCHGWTVTIYPPFSPHFSWEISHSKT